MSWGGSIWAEVEVYGLIWLHIDDEELKFTFESVGELLKSTIGVCEEN